MNLDPTAELPDPRPDLHDYPLDRVHLRPGPLRALQVQPPKRLHQDIGQVRQKKTKLVGLEPRTGSSVRVKIRLVVLDEKLHLPPAAVSRLAQEGPVLRFQVGDDKPCVRPQGVLLRFDDHPPRSLPALGLVRQLAEQPNRAQARLANRLRRPRPGLAQQPEIRANPQNIMNIVSFTVVHHRTVAVVRIGPKQNPTSGQAFRIRSTTRLRMATASLPVGRRPGLKIVEISRPLPS